MIECVTDPTTHEAVEAVWRLESTRLIAGLVRMVRDVGLAEDLAHDALVAALAQWPQTGVPDNPGAWLMTTAKRRGVDQFRRREHLVAQVVKAGRRECSPHQGTVGRADLGYPRHVEQPPASRRFEFAPQRVGAPQQRDVGGVLEIA